jgi:hypothetical protein
MSEVLRRTCETTTNSTTGQVETVITVETTPPMRALAWMNFLKQRLYILQLDYRQVAAERIVVASRPETADSVKQSVESATEIADQYLNSRREPLLNR